MWRKAVRRNDLMKNQKEVKISFWAAHATTIVSVTLVLLLVGIIALITISAERESRRLREQIELTVIMNDSTGNEASAAIFEKVKRDPSCRQATFISKEEALRQWREDTGEDLERLFGVNPLSPEISLKMKAEYAAQDSLAKVTKRLSTIAGVQEVVAPDSGLVRAMNANISTLASILGVIAIVMLVISFVLINNTVHLTVYARRFTIHTMQLVGATNRFIRMPIVVQNMLAGILAGVIASATMAAAIAAAPKAGIEDVAHYIGWPTYGFIAGGMILLGALLCATAASISTRRYLRKDYDKLFR